MQIYVESIIIFILCMVIYPAEKQDAFHIMMVALMFSFYCFEISASKTKWFNYIGIAALILCFFVPELSVLLPMFYYIFIYSGQYLLPYLYCMPVLIYFFQIKSFDAMFLIPVIGLSIYFGYQSRIREQLHKTIKKLRDDSVEKEMLLREHNEQLIESQNDQIYIATLKERNRIAREIHDNVGHMLSRSILQVGALLAICKDETLKSNLQVLKETLNEAMNNIRNSVHDLHDESIDLKEAMKNIVDSFEFCPIDFKCEISKHLPREIKYCFLAIAKEALNNIIKHSDATEVSVTVKELPGFYQLLIEDNGHCSSEIPDSNSGIGLTNIQDRVHAINGIVHISSEHGFRIFVSVPK